MSTNFIDTSPHKHSIGKALQAQSLSLFSNIARQWAKKLLLITNFSFINSKLLFH